jgi:hypothetical protein
MSDFPEPDAIPPVPEGTTEETSSTAENTPPSEQTHGVAANLLVSGRQMGTSVTTFVRNSPFLCISLAVHLVVLLILAMFTARTATTFQKPVSLQVEEIETEDVELMPLQKEINLSHAGGTVGLPGISAGNQGYEGARGDTPNVTVPTLSILGLEAPTGSGKGGDFEGEHGDGKFNLAPGMGGKSADGAVDQFAIITLNSMAQGRTLVALLIDRSASILYGDLPTVIKRMDHYFDEINRNLPHKIEDVGRWVVVSYADKPKLECEPTCDLEYLKTALRNVQADRSGIENVGLAVEYVLSAYGKQDYKYLLIAAMTDAAGDDIENPVVLERSIERLKSCKARFYVFGYESTFCARDKWVSIPVTQLKGRDLAEYQAYADATKQKIENLRIEGFEKGGPECPRPELWWTDNWHAWRHWGGGHYNIPSGFGMYGLNRMVLSTGGIYFLLRPESNYDEEKLYGQYKPDICSVFTYKQRMEASPLRSLLSKIWQELGYFHLEWDLRDPKTVESVLDRSAKGRQYCAAHIVELQRVLESSKPEGGNWTRWQAHADVTLAEMYRWRFMLGQYHEVLRRGYEAQGRKIEQGKRFVMSTGKVPDDYVGPELAKQEYDAANQYIQLVIDKHKGTPWEEMAKRMKQAVFPYKCSYVDAPKPNPNPPPTTHPPSIGI